MKKATLIAAAVLVVSGMASARDLATYRTTYEKKVEEIVLGHGIELTELGQHYSKALDTLLAKAKKLGDLEKTMAIMAEIRRFGHEKVMPGKAVELPDIQNLQVSYTERVDALELRKAKAFLSIASQYDNALKSLQKRLVVSDKLQKAMAVRQERQRITESANIRTARLTVTANPAPPKVELRREKMNRNDIKPPRAIMASNLKKGLILHYSFDADRKGKVTDSSGKRYHGRVLGSPTRIKGTTGMALDFDGVKDFVALPNNPTLLNVPDSDFSLCAWYRPNAVPAGECDRGIAAIVARQGYHFGLFYRSDKAFEAGHWFDVDSRDRPQCFTVRSGPYDIDEWHHVAEMVSVTDKTITLCIDGKVVAKEVSPYKWQSHLNDKRGWWIGIAAPGSKTCRSAANGAIDDVRIYNRALSQEEVSKIHELTGLDK